MGLSRPNGQPTPRVTTRPVPGAHPLADCGLADCDGDGIEDSIGGAVGDLRRYHSSWCEAGGAHTVLSDHASDVAAAAAAAAGSAVWHCAIVADFLAAVSGRGAAPAMPPSAPPPPPPAGLFHGDDQEFYCSRVELGGADLCHHYPWEYLAELAAWIVLLSYRLTHLPLSLVALAAFAGSVAAVAMACCEQRLFTHLGVNRVRGVCWDECETGRRLLGRGARRQGRARIRRAFEGLRFFTRAAVRVGALATSLEAAVGYELLRCVAMLCAAHTVGVLHHFHHARGMWRRPPRVLG